VVVHLDHKQFIFISQGHRSKFRVTVGKMFIFLEKVKLGTHFHFVSWKDCGLLLQRSTKPNSTNPNPIYNPNLWIVGQYHCHPIIPCSSKIQNGLPFWCRLTQVVLEKRPLNRCSVVVVVVVVCKAGLNWKLQMSNKVVSTTFSEGFLVYYNGATRHATTTCNKPCRRNILCNDHAQPTTPIWHCSVCRPHADHAQPATDKAPLPSPQRYRHIPELTCEINSRELRIHCFMSAFVSEQEGVQEVGIWTEWWCYSQNHNVQAVGCRAVSSDAAGESHTLWFHSRSADVATEQQHWRSLWIWSVLQFFTLTYFLVYCVRVFYCMMTVLATSP